MIDADSQVLPEDIIVKLDSCLDVAGVPTGRGRVKAVTEGTGYSQGMVSKLLSGKSPITPRFITVVCTSFGINPEWIYKGTEPVLLRNYPLHRLKTALSANAGDEKKLNEEEFCEMLIDVLKMKPEEVSLVMAGTKPISLKIAEFAEAEAGIGADWILRGEGSMNPEVDYVRRLRLRGRVYDRVEEFESILKYNGYIREDGSIATECERLDYISEKEQTRITNEKIWAIKESVNSAIDLCSKHESIARWNLVSKIISRLTKLDTSELIDLYFQLDKLLLGDRPCQDLNKEFFRILGIKPITRLKLERIPVESDKENQEK